MTEPSGVPSNRMIYGPQPAAVRAVARTGGAVAYGAVGVYGIAYQLAAIGPIAGDLTAWAVVVLHSCHIVFAAYLGILAVGGGRAGRMVPHLPAVFLFWGLVQFLFAYIFASAANMDYVQRFIASGGNLRLAIDTAAERAVAARRFLPMLVLNGIGYVGLRGRWGRRLGFVRRTRAQRVAGGSALARVFRRYGLGAAAVAAFLVTLSQPSFLVRTGVPAAAFVAYVPLFLLIGPHQARRSAGSGVGSIAFGVAYGILATLLKNTWLGTFSLVSLHVVVVIFLVFYALFVPVLVMLGSLVRRGGWLFVAAAFTFFEFATSSGFLGYPWGLAGHSLYRSPLLTGHAAVTGVWGVSFLVYVVNAAIATVIARLWFVPRTGPVRATAAVVVPAAAAATAVVAVMVYSAVVLPAPLAVAATSRTAPTELGPKDPLGVRVALIQQNTDPRKADYAQTFAELVLLTDYALAAEPDLVVWPETAFVPNIRRWSQADPRREYFAALVRRFLDYQRSMGTWLLTGNDDYESVEDADGQEIARNNYNAAILFDHQGGRRETYRKIRLVPFTEHFPYRESLPWVYDLLLAFDVHFWQPGDRRTVFDHPRVRFSTPICFEDVFPDAVRQFVSAGAQLIVNISNDYWSLTEVQGEQHFAAAVFRSIENRRPMVRATASGRTVVVDPYGRVVAGVGYFAPEFLVADVPAAYLRPGRTGYRTVYNRWGDWFPWFCLVLCVGCAVPCARRQRRRPAATPPPGGSAAARRQRRRPAAAPPPKPPIGFRSRRSHR